MSSMELKSDSNAVTRHWQSFVVKVIEFFKMLKKIGEDDPRRVIHSLKVGVALTLVSMFYYINPIFKDFGDSAIWAVLTVVLVMEFTVGAAISKGLNRTCATFLAGALGVGAHRLAMLFGERAEPMVLGVFVFLIAMAATFARFIPELKAKYDYGMLIFILTFCLVTISSFREEKIIMMARERLSTIGIGVAISFFTTTLVFPSWAGGDLHMLEAANLEKLAKFLQVLGDVYFGEKCDESLERNSFLQGYKSVLNSKSTEDTLANFARWEPPHGYFRFRHPWSQYQKIGAQSRRCAYLMAALDTYISKTEFKEKFESKYHKEMQKACAELSTESAKALNDLASAICLMKQPTAAKGHIVAACTAAEQLNKSFSDTRAVKEILHVASAIALLFEIVESTQQILAYVEELAKLAHFKSPEVVIKPVVAPVSEGEGDHVVIEVKE